MEALWNGMSQVHAVQAAQTPFPWWGWPLIIIVLLLAVLLCWWPWGTKKVETAVAPGVRATDVDLPTVATQEQAFSEVKVSEEGKLDDLKVIEGIGPKIAAVLAEAGIVTFSQLAGTSVEKLREILDRPNLTLADPATWAEQARLAALGDWEALKNLQDQLKGGRLG